MDIGEIYLAQVEAIADLVVGAGDRVDAPVPACPEWRVRDVVAHVAGLARDAATGNLPVVDLMEQWRDEGVAAARDTMTAAQVARHHDGPVDEVVEEWRSLAASMAPMLTGAEPFPDPAPFGLSVILVTDLAVHDQDLRGALGAPRAQDGPPYAIALAGYGFAFDYRLRQSGLPALGVAFDGEERVLGEGDPAATVTADRFELVRMFGGRRSRAQILAASWSGDATPYLPLIPAYGERADDLLE